MESIKLGNKVRDLVTGFEGIAVTHIDYLDGSDEYGVKGKVNKTDDKMPGVNYISTCYLEKIDEGIHVNPAPKDIGFRPGEEKG